MNIVFFGTSTFAVPSLKALTQSPHKILLMVTQPDRKKGRHLKLTPPIIKEVATSLDIPIYQPIDASGDESTEKLRKLNADLFVVVSFGQILSEKLLEVPRKFSINLHASLLPRYRGAAPINWALINGEKKTGVTVFRLEKKMDAGDVILRKELQINENDNAITLSEKLAQVGAKALTEVVDLIDKDKAVFKKQDEALVSFAPKIKKSDGLINWELSASELHNRIRGFLPWPTASTVFRVKILKILDTKVLPCEDKQAPYGQILTVEKGLGITVKTGAGCLAITRLQIEGSRPMGFEEFLRGHRLEIGDILGK